MRWVAIFENPPEMAPVQERYLQDHLAYLRRHRDEIVLAGGLRHEPGQLPHGGLWVLEVASRERAVELAENDPYFIHGRRRYSLSLWGKALPEVQVQL